MKKFLSFLAAGIAALGLASCSGDLHNEFDPKSELAKALFNTSIKIEDFETFELAGDMQSWDDTNGIKFTQNEEGTWETDFVAPDAEDMGFCFLTQKNTVKGTWAGQVGGDKIEADSLPDGVKYVAKDNGFGGYDAVLSGLKAGTTYKMTVDASTGVYVISVEKTTAAKPTAYILNGYFVVGNFVNPTWSFSLDNVLYSYTTDSDKNVYYTFEGKFSSNFYDFRLAKADWSDGIGNKELEVGKDYVELDVIANLAAEDKINSDGNCMVKDASVAKNYRICIKTTPDKKVYIKIVELSEYILTVNVTDLPAALNGTEFYLRGGINSWDTVDTYKGTVTNGELSISWSKIVEGSEFELDFEGKFSVGKGAVGDRSDNDGWGLQLANSGPSNISFTFSDSEPTMTFKYADDTGISSDGCTYYVIEEE